MPSRCVYYLFTQYGEQKQQEGIERLSRIHKEVFPGQNKLIVVLDNKLAGKNVFIKYSDEIIKLSGDNSNREFSAYDKGIQFLKGQFPLESQSSIVIANDTFFSNYGDDYLKGFSSQKVIECQRLGAVLGYIDRFPKTVTLSQLGFQQWIRTSFLFASFEVLNKIGSFTIPWNAESLFTGSLDPFFSSNAPLSDNYQSYLRFWLFDYENKVSEFPFEWHSKKPLTLDNLESFHGKTCSILAEHYFSARAQNLGIPLLSLNTQK